MQYYKYMSPKVERLILICSLTLNAIFILFLLLQTSQMLLTGFHGPAPVLIISAPTPAPWHLTPTPADLYTRVWYSSLNYPYKFMFPVDTQINTDQTGDGGDVYGESIYHSQLGMVTLQVHENPQNLSARQWYELHKADFNLGHTSEIGEKLLNNASIYIAGYPSSCEGSGEVIVFITYDKNIYQFQGIAPRNKPLLEDTGISMLLSSLVFTKEGNEISNFGIPKEWTVIPTPAQPLVCPSVEVPDPYVYDNL